MAPHEPIEPGEAREPPPAKRPLRILVVDDDRDAVMTLSEILQQEGHEVFKAYTGAAVLSLVRSHEPDAVLLDIGMPGATGFEVARELRLRLGRACPALIAITAWTQAAAREMGRLAGFKHYLTKPYSTAELRAVLASLAPTAR
ncbi:MAG TPA: response regulator [Burkholderiales bacterium]|nr:response regulator [Burkholderiales bacterium]